MSCYSVCMRVYIFVCVCVCVCAPPRCVMLAVTLASGTGKELVPSLWDNVIRISPRGLMVKASVFYQI